MDAAGTYRVVGVRADGARVVVDDGLSTERAHHIRMLLIGSNAFPDVRIEADNVGVNDSQHGKRPAFYRVVVIRDDGTGEVRVRNLSRQFAETVVRAISDGMNAVIEQQDGVESVADDNLDE